VIALLAVLFFFSGAAALAYQVAWLRMLSLVFGVTVYAASTVLTSFMGGLALGSLFGGRVADRVGSPVRIFALLELGIAFSALAVPFALEGVSELYTRLHASWPAALPQLTAARFLCSALVLLVPTTLMGASLPMLARHVADSGGAAAARIGWLYAVNTGGGIAGTVLTGFVLIGAIGVTATTRLAAMLNVAVGIGALVLPARSTVAPADDDATALSRRRWTVLAVMFLSGFAGLALEIVWFRLLTLFLAATTYAFTTMLSTVLLGIALGSAIAAARVRRTRDPVVALAWIQIWIGALVILSMTALAHTYRIGWRTSGIVQACVVAMLPATALMGATFPYAVAAWVGSLRGHVGRDIGLLYALNVCGAVLGSLVAGFVLVPLLGTRASLLLLAAVYTASGCVVLAPAAGRRPGLRIAVAGAVLFGAVALSLPDIYGAILARRYEEGERLVFRAEGVQTTATVHTQQSGRRVLYLDGLHQANDSADMVRVHAEIGHLPMALHPNPGRALIVGVGGGVTAGAVAAHPDTNATVVELAESVVTALPYFAHVNGSLLQRPNVHVRVDDGRNFLRMTGERFDVITADLIQPIHAGAGNLYSAEYFTLARRALNEDGLMLQWIGRREDMHYKLIMRTFLSIFPHATLWSNGDLMVGGLKRLQISRAAFERKTSAPDVRAALATVGLDTFDALLDRYTAGPDEMRRFAGSGPVLTDDRPLLEFHRSIEGGPLVDVSLLRGDVRRHVVP
jgi:spermidine synthase